MSFEMSVCNLTTLRLDSRSLILGRCRDVFASPSRPGRLWGPPSHLSVGYRDDFARGKAHFMVKLITRHDLEPTLRMHDPTLHSPSRIQGVVFT
jgi:hypothetical protein